jgi:DNA-binding NarL/FixJ family response regulator
MLSQPPITVSIVEDDRGTRETLAALLNQTRKICCLGAYGTGEEALRRIPQKKPDVALVDINLPGMNGIMCVAGLKARLPDLQVLILTRYDDSGLIFDALRAGASGYLLKKMISTELILAIEQVRAGGAPMSMQIAREVVSYFSQIKEPDSDMEKLSKREQEVLALLAKGYLYKEIGEILGITTETVRVHGKHIYEKLHVRSRAEATAKYFGRSD